MTAQNNNFILWSLLIGFGLFLLSQVCYAQTIANSEPSPTQVSRCSKSALKGYKTPLNFNASNNSKANEICKVNIPVVVHVIHNEEEGSIGGTNISEEQIESQINRLNEDFGATNLDLDDVPEQFFQDISFEAKIRFCLASESPLGETSNGITRTYSSKTTFSLEAEDAKAEMTGGADGWPPCSYLNIWLVPNLVVGDTLILGYAQMPEGNPETDGVVMVSTYFGDNTGSSIPEIAGPYYKGRTATHEIGHWLGLFHPFNNGCESPGDGIEDTPFQVSESNGCPQAKYSCGSPDMFMNFMDFSDDECLLMFTKDQAAYMKNIVQNLPSRSCFLDLPNACSLTLSDQYTHPTAISSTQTICLGDTVYFAALGNPCIQEWFWNFNSDFGFHDDYGQEIAVVFEQSGVYGLEVFTKAIPSEEILEFQDYPDFIEVLDSASCSYQPCDLFIPGDIQYDLMDTLVLGGPFSDVNNLSCELECNETVSTNFEVYSNQAYVLDNLEAGDFYAFDICSGPNAGSWEPVLSLYYYEAGQVGELVAFNADCYFEANIPEDGSYILIISEAEQCNGLPSNEIENGYLSINCLNDTSVDCQCVLDLSPVPEDIENLFACSGETFNLEVASTFMGDFVNPNVIWLASQDPGPDGILATADDILTGEQLDPDFSSLSPNTVIIGLGNERSLSYTNTTCETKSIYVYASVADIGPSGGTLLNCPPQEIPYLEFKIDVEPELSSLEVDIDAECGFEINSSCLTEDYSTELISGIDGLDSLFVFQENGCFALLDTFFVNSCSNTAPIAVDDFANLTGGDSITISILENDIDAEGDAIVVQIDLDSSIGATINYNDSSGQLSYSTSNFTYGIDTLNYVLSDGIYSDTAEVIIEVIPNCLMEASDLVVETDTFFICSENELINLGNSVLSTSESAEEIVHYYMLFSDLENPLSSIIQQQVVDDLFEFNANDYPNILNNTVYYIAIVSGPSNENDSLDLTHPCNTISNIIPLVYLEELSASIEISCEEFYGGIYEVSIILSGGKTEFNQNLEYEIQGDYNGFISYNNPFEFVNTIDLGYTLSILDAFCPPLFIFGESNCIDLPVELLSFEGEDLVNQHLLKWKIAAEENLDYYLLEQSADGTNFEELAKVHPQSIYEYAYGSYSFTNELETIQKYYYRLSSIDFDGSIERLGTLTLGDAEQIRELLVFQNENQQITVLLPHLTEGIIEFRVYNGAGQLLMNQHKTSNGTPFSYQIDLSTLSKGVLFLQVNSGEELNKVKQFVNW